MTAAEWASITERMVAAWPHGDWPKVTRVGSLDRWYADLSEFPAERVSTAVEALYRSGREFPPNGAQIRAQIIDLEHDAPTWPEVWELLWKAMRKHGHADTTAACDWLGEKHPLVGTFARRLPFRDFCLTREPSVFHGQARRQWEALVEQTRRDESLRGLPEGGLRRLERVNSQPRRIGDVLRGLTPPKEEG